MLKKFGFLSIWIYLFFGLMGPLTAQTLVPTLKPGQHVYTVPADFEPPLIGKAGVQEIEAAAGQLHYPYFVVLVKDLPGGSDQAAARLLDSYAAAWTERFPNVYDPARSQIFLLTYNPRKFRFLAGSTFKNELGFEKDAHVPFTDLFVKSVSGTPKTPKTGIIAMMQAVDEYLFTHSDPQQLAQRRQTWLLWSAGAVLVLLLLAIWLRLRKLQKMRQLFAKEVMGWEQQVENAYQQFSVFVQEERELIVNLKEMKGQTQVAYAALTQLLDEIMLSLEALSSHLQTCKEQAASAHFFNSAPLQKAREQLNHEIEWDTRKANQSELFGNPTLVLKLKASSFMQQVQQHYLQAQKSWQVLKAAVETAWKAPEESFLLELSKAFLAYPERLHRHFSHPLCPELAAKARYLELEQLRWQDVLAYQAEITRLHSQHQEITEQLQALQQACQALALVPELSVPAYTGIKFPAAEDPKLLLAALQAAYQTFQQALDSDLPYPQLQPQLQALQEQYQAYQALQAEIQQAISEGPALCAEATQAIEALQLKFAETLAQAEIACKTHKQCPIKYLLSDTESNLQDLNSKYAELQRQLKQQSQLEAWRTAQALLTELEKTKVAIMLERIQAVCHNLQARKQEVETLWQELHSLAEIYNARLASDQPPLTVPDYTQDQPQDYQLLLVMGLDTKLKWMQQFEPEKVASGSQQFSLDADATADSGWATAAAPNSAYSGSGWSSHDHDSNWSNSSDSSSWGSYDSSSDTGSSWGSESSDSGSSWGSSSDDSSSSGGSW